MSFSAQSVFIVAIFGSVAGNFKFPVTKCKRDSADYSACLKRALEEAWPQFIKGIPEFDIPPLDPFFYKYAKFELNSGEIRGEVILSNTSVIGLSKTRFFNVRTYFLDDVFRLEVDVQVPSVFVEGAVKVNGTLNAFRVAGEGHFNATANDVRGTCDLTGHVVNDTWVVEHFRISPSLGKFKIYFDNLFQDSKELNDFVVNFVNEYWSSIYRILLPIAADIWDPWLVDFVNKIFSKVSFSKMFL